MSGVAWKLAIRQYYDLMIHTSVTMYWTIATSKQITKRETRERWVSIWCQTSYTLVDSLLSRLFFGLALVGHFRMYSNRRGLCKPHTRMSERYVEPPAIRGANKAPPWNTENLSKKLISKIFATSFASGKNLAETFRKLLTLTRLKKGRNAQIEANNST